MQQLKENTKVIFMDKIDHFTCLCINVSMYLSETSDNLVAMETDVDVHNLYRNSSKSNQIMYVPW